jgi:hypothetical protein
VREPEVLRLEEAETLRPEEYAARDQVKVAVLVQYHGRQIQIVVDPEGDSWDWAVSEFVRTAIQIARREDAKEAAGVG